MYGFTLVATVAFDMGINISDIQRVIHFGLSIDIEEYTCSKVEGAVMMGVSVMHCACCILTLGALGGKS